MKVTAIPVGSKNKPKPVYYLTSHQGAFILSKEPNEAMLSVKEDLDRNLSLKLRAEGKIADVGEPFERSDQIEIDNLIQQGVFEFMKFDKNTHSDIRFFKSRFVREIKHDSGGKPYEKSRLVIQGYGDEEKREILTQSPTIQRASQRLMFAIAPTIMKILNADIYLRDITQAYVQSAMKLNRTIYAKLPKELIPKYAPGTIMRVIKPLYGIAESGLFWWETYHHHHLEEMAMMTSTFDPCLLVTDFKKVPNDECFGIIAMQTDDTLILATSKFNDLEEMKLAKANFMAKPKTKLTTNQKLQFNGCTLIISNGTLTIRQNGQSTKLELVSEKDDDFQTIYVQQRARGAYIASICQPEASYDLSKAAQNISPDKLDWG
ncbi:hypothetical protein EV44_g1525 [Erysiphe necator]|uniref:Reverse transcriptase Ty1/copia-type domain-containing protein n=1 Tax=Uncinula necator TaxID=52586 RepID=A0A0B1P1K2_UNCNE|nr:hypothetical protein EV44_g1525 [Erysiphe necator]